MYAMASDFSVAWQCLSKRTIVFFLYGSNSMPTCDNLMIGFWGEGVIFTIFSEKNYIGDCLDNQYDDYFSSLIAVFSQIHQYFLHFFANIYEIVTLTPVLPRASIKKNVVVKKFIISSANICSPVSFSFFHVLLEL
jgi:hypothetical protein